MYTKVNECAYINHTDAQDGLFLKTIAKKTEH
jgi:hypothetical protein